MKKRILTVLLAVCLVFALGTVTALADDSWTEVSTVEDLTSALNNGGNIKLMVGFSGSININHDTVLDLNGTTQNLQVGISADVTIMDSSEDHTGTITQTDKNAIVVWNGASLTIESGNIESNITTIYNLGSLTINGGNISGETAIYHTARNGYTEVEGNRVCNINGGTISGDYGLVIMGNGMAADGSVNNDKVVTNITGGVIRAENGGQAIGTNASGGAYAGFKLNISGGTIDGGEGTAMYLPGYGITNITGGNIMAGQAIRIASGILNISGGTVTGTTVSNVNDDDLVPGGSGGTQGAVVVGKAGDGYVGNVEVNIYGDAVIQNTATEEGTKPAIVVSDKNMADTDDQVIQDGNGGTVGNTSSFADSSIVVNVSGIEVTGDIIKISDQGTSNSNDGGSTSLSIENSTVNGNVLNQSKAGGITVTGTSVTGSVSVSKGTGNITVIDSSVGEKSESGIILVNSSVGSGEPETSVGNYVAVVDGIGYTTLDAAIDAAEDGDTITLVANIEEDSFAVVITNKAITIDGNGYEADITVAPTTDGTIAFDLSNSDLTLTDIVMTINGSTLGGTGFDVKNNGSSLTLDNADISMDKTKRGIVFSISNNDVGKVNIINGSSLTFNGLSANASNGGIWNISNSTVDYINLGAYAHAMSVETAVINDSIITVDGTGLFGLYGSDVTLNSGTVFNISNAGYNMPYENWNKTETYNYPVEIKDAGDATLIINEGAVLNITGCTNKSGAANNNIYVVAGTTYTNNGTVNANIVMQPAPDGQNAVTVVNNGVTIYSGYVADNGSFTLPAPDSRNGYTFRGWKCNNQLYKAGETVKVSTDMTFTAIWNAINIPDTYDIELIVGEGGEAKASYSNASAGTTITITVAPDEGYELDYITVDGERISGTTFKMPDHDVTVRVYFTDGTSALPFTDVSANQWFYEAVSYVYTNGMMEGDSATTFNPDGRMTRAMFWAVLGRIDGATITGANWVETARSWAMAEGVSDGTNPNDYVTREMMVTMLWRYAGEPASDESLSGYSDAASVSDWAAEAMSWALETGVIEGVTATTLQPQGTATRAQCATIFMRYDMI